MRGVSVKIACEGAGLLELDELVEFQGELKSLSEKNYQRLKTEILDTGMGFPFRVWRHDGKPYIIGGHQTKRTLIQMRDKEGFTVPRVPVVWIEARDYKEARRRVLQDVAQYGQIERQGLYEFLHESEMSFSELNDKFDLPNTDMESFKYDFFEEAGPGDRPKDGGSRKDEPKRKDPEIEIDKLKPHPKNFRKSPDDHLHHIMKTINDFGVYRSIVTSNDFTILTGHAIYEAAKKLGMMKLPVNKLDLDKDDTKALKILLNDNELGHLCETDDRLLCDILKYIKDTDPSGLVGTGYDEKMLANLVFVTRPASEVENIDEAAHWVGLPEYEEGKEPFRVIISFDEVEKVEEFMEMIGVKHFKKMKNSISLHWPEKEREDISSVRFDNEDGVTSNDGSFVYDS